MTGQGDYSTNIGGLVGLNEGASISNSAYEGGTVSGHDHIGGLVGKVIESSYDADDYWFYRESTINSSSASGAVQGNYDVGGLVGYLDSGSDGDNSVSNSNASATVIGLIDIDDNTSYHIGGLVDINYGQIGTTPVSLQ